jgi:hypothetical protein
MTLLMQFCEHGRRAGKASVFNNNNNNLFWTINKKCISEDANKGALIEG